MILPEAVVFACDARPCNTRYVCGWPVSNADAYLSLVAGGWRVDRKASPRWRHFCPEHADTHTVEVSP